VGAISFKDGGGTDMIVSAGQLVIFSLTANSSVQISNPYEQDLINFLEIKCKALLPTTNVDPRLFSFDVNAHINSLIPVITQSPTTTPFRVPTVSIGKFEGRKEAIYAPQTSKSKLFVFVIQGAFEVQGRLMHPRDGLALWGGSEDIELEALSNEAIIVLIEQFED
jgi:hypothetical protein